MGRKELITIVVAVVSSMSALFGAISYVETRFIDRDEITVYMEQIISTLSSVEDRLQSIEEALRK